MANTVKVDQFAAKIAEIMAEYQGVAMDVLQASVDAVSKETVRELKASSPKLTGDYAKSWTQTKTAGNGSTYGKIVHNKQNYRLTHLLEYGHAKRGGGRTKAQPHIAPAEEHAVEEFEKKLTEGIENAIV